MMRVAAIDLGRAYSATWSSSRLRTLLIDECIRRNLQIHDPVPEGKATVAKQSRPGSRELATPDLVVLDRGGRKMLTVDLLCGSQQGEGSEFSSLQVYNAIARLTSGHIDAIIVSADADSYGKLHAHDTTLQGRDATRVKVFTAVLPPMGEVSMRQPRRITIDDTTMTIYGARVTAFGMGRVVVGACQSN